MLSRTWKATTGGYRHGTAWRDHRQGLARDRATLAQAKLWPERRSMERSSHHHQRHPLEATHWFTLARSSREIRSLANLLRPLQSLEARWYLGSFAGPCPDQVGCSRRGRVGGECRRHGDPGSPTRRGSQKPAECGRRKKGLLNPEEEALGRSRGGFSTKVHLACDGKGRPLSIVLTPGQRHSSTQLEELLDTVRIPRPEGSSGRPRKRPDHLLADKAYSLESCRRLLRRRSISHTIPERKDQKERRAGRPGRRPGFDWEAYRRRNVVERCVNKLKHWRGIATRYEKRAVNYRAMVVIASLMIWLPS